ncbi:fimbrial protein [Pseudomonas entomophila]|uniref:fimbrial protein n=1 Tax=Pseudomonas entomophila TaxID=312306 RepID=UPI0015E3CA68|nr:fimbrial protein [Pseudomonas entomophila]MBA1187474.1 fimbrial protein [Pseudomonas entomophila]
MKRSLITLSLMTAASAAHALPDTGTILFSGKVNGNTCSIEITDPGNGAVLNPVVLPEGKATQFTAIGEESAPVSFGIKITDGTGCDTTGKKGYVSFAGMDGAAGQNNELHALRSGSAKGVALAIKDSSDTLIAYGANSKEYDLNASKTMVFKANLRSTADSVSPGPVNATVPFVFDIK